MYTGTGENDFFNEHFWGGDLQIWGPRANARIAHAVIRP